MRKLIGLLVALFLLAVVPSAFGQAGNTVAILFPGVPTGSCAYIQIGIDAANGVLYVCPAGTWQAVNPTGGGTGTVTSVALTVPSWLTVTGSPVTAAGTLAVAPTTGQTSHQVIGTCGSATTFAPCVLGYSDLSGTPTLPATTSAVTHEWFSSYSASSGAFGQTQPAFSDLSGSIALGQTALTTNGDLMTVSGGALARLALGGANTFVGNCGGVIGFCAPSGTGSAAGSQYAIQDSLNGLGGFGAVGPAAGYAGVPQLLACVTGSACTITTSGIPGRTNTNTSDPVVLTDRGQIIYDSNAGAIARSLPQAGSTNFDQNFDFKDCNIGAGTVTITPTTSTIAWVDGTQYHSPTGSMSLTTGQCAFIHSPDNVNYEAILGPSGSSGITLKTNGTNNGSQTTLNLAAGSNISVTDNGSGTVTIAASNAGSTIYLADCSGTSGGCVPTSDTVTSNVNWATSATWTTRSLILAAGDVIDFELSGTVTTGATNTTPALDLKVQLGSSTLVGEAAANSSISTSQTANPWYAHIQCIVTTAGASGAMQCSVLPSFETVSAGATNQAYGFNHTTSSLNLSATPSFTFLEAGSGGPITSGSSWTLTQVKAWVLRR